MNKVKLLKIRNATGWGDHYFYGGWRLTEAELDDYKAAQKSEPGSWVVMHGYCQIVLNRKQWEVKKDELPYCR